MRRRLAGIVIIGLLARILMAVLSRGNGDIDNELKVAGWLVATPLHIYRREQISGPAWPYLSGYFPVLVIARAVHVALGIRFALLARFPVIAANVFLVWLVDLELVRRGHSDANRLTAAAGLMFSPLLLFESGWHAQLDMVSTAFAGAGVVVWERLGPEDRRRVPAAGGLIAVAALIKTVPGIAILALIPNVRRPRELFTLLGSFLGVAACGAAPWLIAEHHALVTLLKYQGIPGEGGLSVLVQPALATIWLNGHHVALSSLQIHLQLHARTLTEIALVVSFLVLLRARPRPVLGVILLYLAVYASAANIELQYLVWIIPFLYLAGAARATTWMQLLLAVPTLLLYIPALGGTLLTTRSPWAPWVTHILYVPAMDLLWCLAAGVLCLLGSRSLGRKFG